MQPWCVLNIVVTTGNEQSVFSASSVYFERSVTFIGEEVGGQRGLELPTLKDGGGG